MAQSSISSYFNTRKRKADDFQLLKDKATSQPTNKVSFLIRAKTEDLVANKKFQLPVETIATTRSGRRIKRVGSTQLPPDVTGASPEKKAVTEKDVSGSHTFAPKENTINKEPQQKNLKDLVKKELTFEEVGKKVSRSEKLKQLKESLQKIQQLEKTRKEQENRNRRLKEEPVVLKENGPALKEFDKIEMEILVR